MRPSTWIALLLMTALLHGPGGCGSDGETESREQSAATSRSPGEPDAGAATASAGATAAPTGETLTLAVHGMHCQGCADAIQSALENAAGVISCAVTLDESLAVVSYEPARIDPAAIGGVIAAVGYSAEPVAAAPEPPASGAPDERP
jgi:copper chaperone CopZ